MKTLSDPRGVERRLQAIADDRTGGATRLADRAMATLSAAAPRPTARPLAYLRTIDALARRLCAMRPGMPVIAAATTDVIGRLRKAARDCPDAAAAHRQLRRFVREERLAMKEARASVIECFGERFAAVRAPLLVSHSSAVVEALCRTNARLSSVTVCESRPLFEGRRVARVLRRRLSEKTKIVVITEAQAARALEECDAFLFGCDAIYPDGSVANKAGSALVALAARRAGVAVVALGDSWRFSERRLFAPEPHDGAEVWKNPPRGVTTRNEYFEIVPSTDITYVVLETGVVRPPRIRTLWNRRLRERGSAR